MRTQLNLFVRIYGNIILTETIKFVFTQGTFTFTVPHSSLWNNSVIVPASIHQLMGRRSSKVCGCWLGIKLFLCRSTKHFLCRRTKHFLCRRTKHFLWRGGKRFLWRSVERFLWRSTERFLCGSTERFLWRSTKRYLWRRTS